MEYRMKYRDIPWPIALSVLPGKVLGTFFIKPGLYLKQNWRHSLKKLAIWAIKFFVIAFLITSVFLVLDVVITDHLLMNFFVSMWHKLMAIL